MSEEFNPQQEVENLININQLDLESELATVSAYYYRFGILATEAEETYENKKLDLEIYEAQLSRDIRAKHNTVSTNNPNRRKEDLTITQIKQECKEDSHWRELYREVLEAQNNYKIMDKAVKAFEIKSRMLSSLNRRDLYKRQSGMVGNHEEY